ncbi:MAG: hypothetical protein K2N78_03530 [Oscillospiraceae bacterium]|nr:hypothetical protein [Oscillospiraceae bacterium]
MRKAVYTVIALLLPLVLCACGLSEEELRERAIGQLNRNSDLPFSLILPETELGDVSAYSRGGGWGCWSLFNEDADITLSGWPDVLDSYCVTDIRLRTAKYSVFGLRVGDTAARAGELLEPKGYELVPDVRGWGDAYYLKDGVIIHLELSGEEITELTVYVQSTNLEGVDF